MKKLSFKSAGRLLAGAVFVLGGVVAHAATIGIVPQHSTVEVWDEFSLDLVGTDFTNGSGGSIGGGVSVHWDPTILTLVGSTTTFPGDGVFGQEADTTTPGWFLNLDVTSFNGSVGPDFPIATLNFVAIALGTSEIGVEIGTFDGGSDRIWADSLGLTDASPDFKGGSVNVVPIPAAAWLFGSALLGLITVARRKQLKA